MDNDVATAAGTQNPTIEKPKVPRAVKNSDVAISIDSLSKIYRIGAEDHIQESFAAQVTSFVRSPFSNYQKYRSLYNFDDVFDGGYDERTVLWALRDISFEVKKGEVIGIVGINGAGKSTLLKVLSKITPPTRGRIEICGRVSSLLEVGTGFHQELTGRENVFLNGTVLGMTKREVEDKFDEIVEFSGVEKFLDTPVKRYSSGMRVRLAFAVAAYLEPEILIIDEVLAVGDAAFQKQCLNKMQDVGQEGRTVLFVSHNMPAVTRLCERCILLNNGQVIQDGDAEDVVSSYLNAGHGTTAQKTWPERDQAPGDDVVRLRAVRVRTEDGTVREGMDIRQAIGVEMEFDVAECGHNLMPYYDLFNEEGTKIFAAIDLDPEWEERHRSVGRYVSTAWIPGNLLSEGLVYVRASIRTDDRRLRRFSERDVIAFHVIDSGDPDSARGSWPGRLEGTVRPRLRWETRYEPI